MDRWGISRRRLGQGLLGLAAPAVLGNEAWAAPAEDAAVYRIALAGLNPPRFLVDASLPASRDLRMADTYPAELPVMARGGWPLLVSNLRVSGQDGGSLSVEGVGPDGWRVQAPPAGGRIALRYEVDLGVFEAAGWSSPLESAVADRDSLMVCGRALFITAPGVRRAHVGFSLAQDWRAIAPWPGPATAPLPFSGMHAVASPEDLTDNLLVFSRTTADTAIATAAGFTLQITAMGHWAPLRSLIRDSLTKIIARETALTGWKRPETYNVVLIPTVDRGGEAYRQSFAYCFPDPTAANRAEWANTLAHEIFHYWNYARLKGADYASTQWFQEGFTEYAANLTLVQAGITTPEQFVAKLDGHLANARKLTTTLENIGTRKGPPLYSAGALTAFCFDVMLRHASHGRRDIGDLFRGLLKATGEGARPYAWIDIRAALAAAAPGEDWEGFYQRHIRGAEPLPLARVLPMAGLMLSGDRIVGDIRASVAARALWAHLVRGR